MAAMHPQTARFAARCEEYLFQQLVCGLTAEQARVHLSIPERAESRILAYLRDHPEVEAEVREVYLSGQPVPA